jgi:hypothetical protein
MRKGIRYAKLKGSPRLQRLLAYLRDGETHSTLDIIKGANICAVNSAVDELRENGFDIICKRKGNIWEYRLLGEYQMQKSFGWAGGTPNAVTVDGRQAAAKSIKGETNDNQ